jgi:hypothetical protein
MAPLRRATPQSVPKAARDLAYCVAHGHIGVAVDGKVRFVIDL